MTATVRLCWDSCVIIDLLQQTPDRYPVLRAILADAEEGHTAIVVSALARAELVKEEGPCTHDAIDRFFSSDCVHIRNVDRFIATHAASIAERHGIKPPDAIHVATAIRHRCRSLQTYDGSGSKPRKHHLLIHDKKIGSPALRIELPRTYKQREPRLFPDH